MHRPKPVALTACWSPFTVKAVLVRNLVGPQLTPMLSIERKPMDRHPIEIQIEKADKAIIAEDFDTLLDIYTDDAVLVVEPGRKG